jgi:hypothetical protein
VKRRLSPTIRFVGCIILISLLLTGCMYPKNQRVENQVALRESVMLVQNALEQYRQKTGVLPLVNASMDVPMYEKFVIDFRRLKERGAISQIPAVAFENGGSAVFIVIHPEDKPEVKLMDAVMMQKVNDLQRAVDSYRLRNGGSSPIGAQAGEGIYYLDFGKLGMPVEQVRSPYSPMMLGLLIHDQSGQVAVDYAPEISKLLSAKGITAPGPDVDLRAYLVNESVFSPSKSFLYLWKNNQPTPIQETR